MPLAVPSLTIADLADGTGATATVASSDASSTNTIRVQQFAPTLAASWTSKGSRTGDGTVSLSITTAGIYLGKCDSVLSSEAVTSNIVLFAVTRATTSVHELCLYAVECGVRALIDADALPGLDKGTQVFGQKTLDKNLLSYPCVAVCLGLGTSEQERPGTNTRDDIGYPVYVVYCERQDQNYGASRPDYLLIRERLYRYFRRNTLAGASTVYDCTVEPGPIIEIAPAEFQINASVLTVRCWSREPRGV